MHALVETRTPFVLAGSIRFTGPLPDVITDAVEAQREMRPYSPGCRCLPDAGDDAALNRHGEPAPRTTTTVCVDINPAVVTKLADRGRRRPSAS